MQTFFSLRCKRYCAC